MREIIALQFGTFSNFIGTHFWNTQLAYFPVGDSADTSNRCDGPNDKADCRDTGCKAAEVDLDLLFRSGRNLRGQETFTPRVLVFDLKENFGSVKRTAPLFEGDADAPISSTWSGEVQHHQHEQFAKNQYLADLDAYETAETLEDIEQLATKTYNLDDTVLYWSDFNSVFYHPRSLHQVQVAGGVSELASFDAGYQSFLEYQKEHSVVDEAIRFFAEECDSLQGFHAIVDTHDGFSGFHTHFMEVLRDEYSKADIITNGVSHAPESWPQSKGETSWRRINSARALVHSSELSTLYVPLEFPKFPLARNSRICGGLNPTLRYHTSALLAAALDSISIPYRKRVSALSMSSLVDHVSCGGRYQLASLSTSFPLQVSPSQPYASRCGTPILPSPKSYTFGGEQLQEDEEVYSQCAVLRGGDLLLKPLPSSTQWTAARSTSELLDEYLSSSGPLSKAFTLKQIVNTPFPLVQAFPKITNGLPDRSSQAVPSLSMLQVTSRLEEIPLQYLNLLAGGTGDDTAVAGGAARWCGRESKLSTSAYQDLVEGLKEMRERYAGGYYTS